MVDYIQRELDRKLPAKGRLTICIQLALLLLSMILGFVMSFYAQGGGIKPVTALLCSVFSSWSRVLSPNAHSMAQWDLMDWGLAMSTTAFLGVSTKLTQHVEKTRAKIIVGVLAVTATLIWVLIGLARVAYSMA